MRSIKKITSTKLIITVSFFLVLFYNFSFFRNVINVYPVTFENVPFLVSVFLLFFFFNIFLLSLVSFRKTIKPILITIFLVSSMAAYFMDTYNVIIDESMIDNIIKTDTAETLDLLSVKQIIYFFVLGIFPSIVVYRLNVIRIENKTDRFLRIALFFWPLLLSVALIFSLSNYYASFFREHKPLRFYANPSYYIYSAGKYINSLLDYDSGVLKTIGTDAKQLPGDRPRKLVVMVVGESARADHFSLNGYEKKTNPLLEQEAVISFSNVWSCGTSTAHSVPCMFSFYGRSDFSKSKAASTENVLDILNRAGVNLLWIDNNSSSKGVAERIKEIDYKTPENNPDCDIECRDEGMLVNLQSYIDSYQEGDILIVLHQMGNHGPAYFKRYPKSFEQFTPICQTNQLEQCTPDEISNTYDNILLYTDHFLAKTIGVLKDNSHQFETALLYISDHGESLGEHNVYLHGLPYMVAPDSQTHVPMILWLGDHFDKSRINYSKLIQSTDKKLSHDNLFHTLLGLMDVQTQVYDPSMDIIGRKMDQ